MNTNELFQVQIDGGATEMFFYCLERPEPYTLSIIRHRGTLDSFPANLEFVRMMTDSTPLFREIV